MSVGVSPIVPSADLLPRGVILHASPPALSMASLSLSTSPPSTNIAASLTGAAAKALSSSVLNDGSNFPYTAPASSESPNPKPMSIIPGKKRGVEHKCESCSKVRNFSAEFSHH